MRVVGILAAEDHALILTGTDAELVSLDPGERLEGGAGGAAAVRTMTAERVGKFIRHVVLDRAAITFPGKASSGRHHWSSSIRAPRPKNVIPPIQSSSIAVTIAEVRIAMS